MTLMQALLAKQKLDRHKAEARLEKRRGYAKAGRERERARRLAESGLDDLPDVVALALEQTPTTAPKPATTPPSQDSNPAELVARLEAIKERIFRLHSVYAVSLSIDCAIEANQFLAIFQEIAAQLKSRDPQALEKVVSGHEAILLSPPIPVKQTIPLETQRLVELRWELSQAAVQRPPTPTRPNVPDGLDWLVG